MAEWRCASTAALPPPETDGSDCMEKDDEVCVRPQPNTSAAGGAFFGQSTVYLGLRVDNGLTIPLGMIPMS